jgi:hypothetical protein
VLEEVAPEIPIKFKGDDYKAGLFKLVQKCCGLRKSLVAVDADDRIVAFILALPQSKGKKYPVLNPAGFPDVGEPQPAGLELWYGGVTKRSRRQRIFPVMIDRMKRRNKPLFATVHHCNKSEMAARLMKMGFENVGKSDNQDTFRWMPPIR